jgi:2-polyprenyl-6-methoxyphenol hydroxylase-like FAD-dependent oxidoreductase
VSTASAPALPVSTDVLVVGAGPAGLALGTALALAGVDHLIIDPKPDVDPGTKAAGVQPRTLEYLDRLGVADDLVAQGLPGSGFGLRDGERSLLEVDYSALDTTHPYMLLIGQDATERVLQRRLLDVGGALHRGHRLLGFWRDHPGVTATVAGPDGAVRAVRARYLVGADGVHSAVREGAGIAFQGSSPPALFSLADVRLTEPPADTATSFFLSAHGVLLVSPLPGGRHRIVASAPPGTAAPTAEDVERSLAERGGGPLASARVAEVDAASTYHFQERVAERLVDDPVVLLGDAAHTHSPAGGQGMNTGIQDAADLAWRLTERVRHGAGPDVIAEYEAERRPVAQELIGFTGQLTALATLTDPALASLRNTVLGAAGALDEVRGWLSLRLSQLAIGYGDGPGVVPGNRLAPTVLAARPTSPAWVLADPQAVAPSSAGRVEIVPAPSLEHTALVRPDGVIAAVDVTAEAAVKQLDTAGVPA